MTGPAIKSMLPALRSLWTECFHDDARYTQFLFDKLLALENILVSTIDDVVEAMLCTELFELAIAGGEAVRGAYIFGVATASDRQGRGLSSALLGACHRKLADEGCALSVLVPASESLFGFYRKRGYKTAFEIVKYRFLPEELAIESALCAEPARLETLASFRAAQYADRALFVQWSEAYLRYIGQECTVFGGEVLALADGTFRGYAVCYRDGDSVLIKELAVSDEWMLQALAALHRHFAAGEYICYLPADVPFPVKKVLPFAMVQWYDKEKQARLPGHGRAPWIAHVLD